MAYPMLSLCSVHLHTFVFPLIGYGNMVFGVSNSLDPDQAQYFVRPELCPNFCKDFQETKKVATSRERVNDHYP